MLPASRSATARRRNPETAGGSPAGADPAISVLLPCRDAAEHLPACIDSLSAQTLSDIEILAVDDGSTEGTRTLLDAWAAEDSRVRVEPGGGGLVSALRLATDLARAPLIARMDADDVADPRRFEMQAAWLRARPDAAACGTGVVLFPAQALGSGYRRYEAWINGLVTPEDVNRDLLVECPVAHPALMMRASALRAVGGYRDRGWPEDYDLVLRFHAAGMRIGNVPVPLLRWRVTPGRLSLRSTVYSPSAFRRCKVHFLLEGLLPPGRPLVVWGAGRVGKPLARELAARGAQPAALVDLDPRKIGQEIHGAPVIRPADLASIEDAYVLGAVGSPGAREDIRSALRAMGRTELQDFRMVA
jgi:Glycosyl transferase family 2